MKFRLEGSLEGRIEWSLDRELGNTLYVSSTPDKRDDVWDMVDEHLASSSDSSSLDDSKAPRL